MDAPGESTQGQGLPPVRATLLGPFSVSRGELRAGPWQRPSARRLLQLVLVSPGQRVGREVASEALFPHLGGPAAAVALTKALSMARAALSPLGDDAPGLLRADRARVWASDVVIDVVAHTQALRQALDNAPGAERDELLWSALKDGAALLEEEPYADWATEPREALALLRQEACLALARDRARGIGRAGPEAVAGAWEACLAHDPACEEAASALVRLYGAQGRRSQAAAAYERCRAALEELGLRASPALEEARAASTATTAAPRAGPITSGSASQGEERRLVSVLFAELAGPMGAQARLGPEDIRELMGGGLAGVVGEVERFGGTVTSVSGAGLVGLFGAPEAHEDDPERALRAASRAVSALALGEALSLRAGVETGEAVVGPLGGAHYGALGEVVGTAAALQSVARAGSVLVGPATRAATEGLFEWGPSEDVVTSPGAKPLAATYLERPKARPAGQAGRRALARGAPLVGRQAELANLRDAVRDATAGKGGVVLVAGEAGLGKTRLVYECRKLFMAWVGAASGRLPLWLEGRAAPYAASTPYGLYQQLLAAWVGVAAEDAAGPKRAALERAMKAVFGGKLPNDQLDLVAQVMGAGTPDLGPALARAPEDLQRAAFAALKALVAGLVAHGPTVLVLEDLHWADPTSLRLTEDLAALTAQGPLLLVLTRRPEPDPGVTALGAALSEVSGLSVRQLELCPLRPAEGRDLARALLGGEAPEEVLEALAERAEGNPFFLEERLSSLQENGALVRDGTGWHLDLSVSGEVPDALGRLVRSRVDRLSPGPRQAVVAASVLGPEFGLVALGTVTDLGDGLDAAVSELCSGGLLVELRQFPAPAYRFRHALIQEATYKGLLRDQRRQLHARAAWGLETASEGRLEEVAGVLGHHFAMGGEADRAAHYLELAGDRAASAFANDEAVTSYRYALSLVGREPAGGLAAGPAIDLRAKLAQVLLGTGRHTEAREVLEEALKLAPGEDRYERARLYALLGRVEVADHRYDAALAAFDAADGLIGDHPEDQDQATVDLWLEVQLDGRGFVHYWRNEPDKGAAVVARARPMVEARGTPERRRAFHANFVMQRMREARYRIDEEVVTNCRAGVAAARESGRENDVAYMVFLLGFCLLWYGDLVEAEENLEASLAMAERTGDVVVRARCLCYLNVTALRRHDVAAVRSLAPQAMEAAVAASYPEYVAAAKATQAWVAWQEGRPEDVVALAGEALELWGTTVVSYPWYWLCLWPLISVRLAASQGAEAVEAARQLLVPPQQRLPDELEAAVQAAIDDWGQGKAQRAMEELGAAVELAWRLRYA